jgi:hypothetical protein
LPQTRVICIDEWGPLAVKTYPGAAWVPAAVRATFEPDYGRRGTLWANGAFEPATGEGVVVLSDRRDGAAHLQLLEQIPTLFPAERWLLIEDNLITHRSRDVKTALLAWPEFQILFLPKYAAWLNLIEPWWKQLHSLALKGKRFETKAELATAVTDAVCYWNEHKHPYFWKKKPQHQPTILLGGFSSSLKIHNLFT